MKFQVGDRIEANETGAQGNITGIDDNRPDPQVQVKWDNFPNPYWYPFEELNDELMIIKRNPPLDNAPQQKAPCLRHVPEKYVGLNVVEHYCKNCKVKLSI